MRTLQNIMRAAAIIFAATCSAAEPLQLESGPHQITFDPANGSILSVTVSNGPQSLLHSGESGLWKVNFREGGSTNARLFKSDGNLHFQGKKEGGELRLEYRAPDLSVDVVVRTNGSGFEFVPTVHPAKKTITEICLPAHLQFDPAAVKRFVSPVQPHLGVGAAFNSNFFLPQPPDQVSAWTHQTGGPGAYTRLLGSSLDMRDLLSAPVPLAPTATGREWLGPIADRFTGISTAVTRPSRRSQVDVPLVDSKDGVFFGGSRLNGRGALWRFGGQLPPTVGTLAEEAVNVVIRKAGTHAPGRKAIALVDLTNGPESGSWANGTVVRWRESLRKTAQTLNADFVSLPTPEAMLAACATNRFLAILNPYGEWLPAPANATPNSSVDAIGAYVRGGGNWFEVGGYSFYVAMKPALFLSYGHSYPPVFSDFMHLDSRSGSASVYGVQPRNWAPWSGATNHDHIFIPGRIGFGGEEKSGWLERAFAAFVPAGETWTAPAVHLALGNSAEEDIKNYQRANAINRTLMAKLPNPVFAMLRHATLVKYDGDAASMLANMDKLPPHALIHYSDYLKGGFDKEYPDHLPPISRFGTPEQLRAVHAQAHQQHHMIMPYTNPTWWCDHPRGPTFQTAGEAPLQIGLNGKPTYEKYGRNDGWTITMWHPAVRAANEKTLSEFTTNYPVDLLFQDQCGARGWVYDFNPASPTPLAYVEGMLSLVDDQSRRRPLGTEDGWDRVVNAESIMSGFTFALGPGRRVDWAREMKKTYPPRTWELYPFVQRIAQDKTVLLHHDLGKFVTDQPTLAWTLGLGFAMSYKAPARALSDPARAEWLRWIDCIQKSVCARYIGEEAGTFEHRQGSEATGDDGYIRATYGRIRLIANLSSVRREIDGQVLAPYGFHATSRGLWAGSVERSGTSKPCHFIVERSAEHAELFIFGGGETEVAVPLPFEDAKSCTVTFDGAAGDRVPVTDGQLRCKTPALSRDAGTAQKLWHGTISL